MNKKNTHCQTIIGLLTFSGVITTLSSSSAFSASPILLAIDGLKTISNDSSLIAISINSSSGKAEIELAKHLSKKGVKMYGAHWCGACARQKELFGKQAFAKIKYIECADTRNRDLCNREGVRAYPTWKFPDGRFAAAVFPLSRLADLSGYNGPRNFKN
jgi:hypothetical protein